MVKSADSDIERLFEIARTTNFALWGSLLTVNGLIASIFIALFVFYEQYRIFALGMVIICFITSAMLIKNFRDNKTHLRPIFDIYEMSDAEVLSVPDEVLNKSIEESAQIHDRIESRELLVIRFVSLQAFLIVFFLAYQIFG